MLRTRTISALLGASSLFGGGALAEGLVPIYSFDYPSSVANPKSTLVEISPGLFAGSYVSGLFRITSTGKFAVFSSLSGSPYDLAADGALTPASNGYLYGVRSTPDGLSAIYRISPSGATPVIVNDTLNGAGPLTEASDGDLWGTQGPAGGSFSVFKLSLDGQPLTTVAEGLAGPTYGPLLQASDGNFYGATGTSTAAGGPIYRVTPLGTLTVLHTFPDGEGSSGGLIEASNNLIYGTTLSTEPACSTSGGEIFAISLAGSYQTVYEFAADCEGNGPGAGLLEASDGNLYGTTDLGGVLGDGAIFRIGLDGSSYLDVLAFNYSNGAGPQTCRT